MRAKRSLGQNFLVDRHYQELIIASVAPRRGETIIEIGPGHGALTRYLVESGARIIAIEIDRELAAELRLRFSANPNFQLLEADALEVDYCQLIAPEGTARVVANLPYYISTPILRRLIAAPCISEMTLMLQREVVDRMMASPGGKDYGYLTVLVQFYCELARISEVPPGAFRPAPQVASSVIRIRRRAKPAAEVEDEELFLRLAQALFAQRRKTIQNNLRAGARLLGLEGGAQIENILIAAGIDARRRAESLSLGELASIAGAIEEEKKRRTLQGDL